MDNDLNDASIRSGNVSVYSIASLEGIMKKIRRRFLPAVFSAIIVTLASFLFVSVITVFLPVIAEFVFKPYFLLPGLCSIYLVSFFLFRIVSGHIRLFYFLNGRQKDFYEQLSHHVSHLAFAERLWHINSILPNRNLKNHGGMKQIYQRSGAKIGKALPYFIRSNIVIRNLSYAGTTLYFLPDCILVRRRNRFAYYLYSSLFLYYAEKPSLEKNDPPSDARVLGYRWLHPNKNGSRDRRYKYNPRLPLLLFSEFLIYFRHNFQTYLQISDARLAVSLFSFLAQFAAVNLKDKYRQEEKTAEKKTKTGNGQAENKNYAESGYSDADNHSSAGKKTDSNGQDQSENNSAENDETPEAENDDEISHKSIDRTTLNALRVLGVLPGATLTDIKHNYRLLVKRYHPDLYEKNRSMSKQYAEDKLIEINRAYDHVCRWFVDEDQS